MKRRVVITGLGVVSSIGIGWKDFWKNLLEGTSGISPVESFDTSQYFTHNGGEVKNFRPEEFIPKDRTNSLNKASQLAFVSAKLAIEDSGLNHVSKLKIGVCLGATMGSIQSVEILDILLFNHNLSGITPRLIYNISNQSMSQLICSEYNLSGGAIIFSTACAAGNYAIGYGFDLIRLGKAEVVLAGGIEPFSKVAFTGFNQFKAVAPEKCQPFDKNRKGIIVAEGSGMLLLESLDCAIKRNANIYAEIIGYGLSCDAHHMTTPTVEGIATCMKKALKEAEIDTNDVDYICAHGTGTITNDKNECAAIKEVFGPRYKQIAVSSIKSMLGHTMGAASALEAVACALAVKYDMIPPTINYETPDPDCDIDCVPNKARRHVVNIALNNSYAFGGNNACVIFKKYKN